jgi:hypothetical protein
MMVILVSGCTLKTQPVTNEVIEFLSQVQTNANNEVEISLQLISPDRDFDADPEFGAKMELFDQNNELRAEANMPQNPFLKKGEIYQLFTWRGQLEPGVYHLDWSCADYGGSSVSFEVVNNSSGLISIANQTIESIPPDNAE